MQRLEICGLKVLACTCDGLSVKRAFSSYMTRESLYTKFRIHMQKMVAMSFSCQTHHTLSKPPETAGLARNILCG